MAIVKCPHCLMKISDAAPKCPHCGNSAAERPREQPSKQAVSCPECKTLTPRGGFTGWQIAVAILLFPFGLLALLSPRKPTRCRKCGYAWQANAASALVQEQEERRQRKLEDKRAVPAGGVMVNQPGGTAAQSVVETKTPEERLKNLKEMLDAELLTPGEYESKRAEIIAGI